MTFQVGDVVQLKSGGEPMTVEATSADSIYCVWFNGKKIERATFNPNTLANYQNPSNNP